MRTIEVTKVGVTCSQEGLHRVTLKLRYLEDAVVLLEKDFTEDHKAGQTPAEVTTKFQSKMQKEIDFYKAAEVISNHAQMSVAVTDLANSLEV